MDASGSPPESESTDSVAAAAEPATDEAIPERDRRETVSLGDLPRILTICVLAWLVPGAGHVALGRVRRGALFATVIATVFVGGLALAGRVHSPVDGEPLSYLATLGGSGAGALFIGAHALGWDAGDEAAMYHEYGSTFTLLAGLLNLLVVLDAYDLVVARVVERRHSADEHPAAGARPVPGGDAVPGAETGDTVAPGADAGDGV